MNTLQMHSEEEEEIMSHSAGKWGNVKMFRSLLLALCVCCVPTLVAQTSDATVQVATVTLSSGQLRALHGAPSQLIAAPGVGKALAPFSFVFQYKPGATPYTAGPDDQLVVYMNSAPNVVTSLHAMRFLDQTASQIYMSLGIGGIGVAPQTSLENSAVLVQNNSVSEWTGGDGTLTITVYYTVVTLQ
jgi:hypothetical protein